MFKKFLARLGKGAATVDLRIENRPYQAGEEINGEVHIIGGEVEQKVNHLAVRLMMNVMAKQGSVNRQVASFPLSGSQMILPKEQKVIPFTYQVPLDLPISRSKVSYYFDTQLDIEGGVDRTDVDRLIIEVPQSIQVIFQALGRLGFREKPDSGKIDQFGQEFALFPTQFLAGQVNEVELRFAFQEEGIYVWMEVDCRIGFHEIEARREFFLKNEDLQNEEKLTEILKQYLTEASEQPHLFTQPFSYRTQSGYQSFQGHDQHRSGNPLGGMVGGLALGILGGMLLNEMMGNAAEAFGFDEDGMEEELEVDDSDFGDFGGEGEDF
jgi:sporulation-control protein